MFPSQSKAFARPVAVIVIMGCLFALSMVSNMQIVSAHDTDVPPCLDISGAGKPVLVGGVANSGVWQLDSLPVSYEPSHDYIACAENQGLPVNNYIQLKGWLWDTNLGWISLYCDASGMNQGIACGSQQYAVKVDTDDGEFHGFAWGDNTGWISFNCQDDLGGCTATNTHKVRAETSGFCAGKVYAIPPAVGCTTFLHSPVSTHAWSDNVGWFDLDGITIPLTATGQFTVTITLDPDPTLYTGKDSTLPRSNGADAYTLKATIIDNATGSPVLNDASPYTLFMEPIWSKDTVKLDQSFPGLVLDFNCGAPSENGGAVDKPCGDGGLAYDVSTEEYSYDITSVAPTTNANIYDDPALSGIDDPVVSNEGFYLPSSLSPYGTALRPLQRNDLNLVGVEIQIFNNDAGTCALPYNNGACLGNELFSVNSGMGPVDLKFVPAADVDLLNDNNKPYIEASAGTGESFNIHTVEDGVAPTYFVTLGLDVPLNSTCYLPAFDFTTDGSLGADDTNPSGFETPVMLINNGSLTSLLGGYLLAPDCPEKGFLQNPFLYTKVTYTVGPDSVAYYSAKLPRVTGTSVVNPVAVVRGSVYSTGVSNPGLQQTIRSLGDVSTNILRDTLYNNVKNMTASKTVGAGNATLVSNGGVLSIAEAGIGIGLENDSDDEPTVYYFNGSDVTISSTDPNFTWTGKRTLIVEGGNLFIDQNIYNAPSGAARPKFGIIVLKDLVTGVGGNIYVNPRVTNIQANIFADRSFFSYDGVINPDGTHPNIIGAGLNYGEPYFADINDYGNKTENQLYIEGSLASQNTIGGSNLVKPIIGTGELAPVGDALGTAPSGGWRAQLYDLNHFRSFGAVFERDPVSGNAICGGVEQIDVTSSCKISKDDGSPWTRYDDPPGDLIPLSVSKPTVKVAYGLNNDIADPPPVTDFGAVYFTFDPPPPDLPGFGVISGAEITVRP